MNSFYVPKIDWPFLASQKSKLNWLSKSKKNFDFANWWEMVLAKKSE